MEITQGLVSVIMSNYNTPEEYLREAIKSILNQTYKNFEFIIVDDASTDDSVSVIQSFIDPRIKLIINTENLGLTKSLNIALNSAKGEFIARMDSDDISLPERFEKQVDYLQKHPDVIVCGTWIELFGSGASKYQYRVSCKELPEREELRIRQLFGNHLNIIHPTAMFMRDQVIKHDIHYNENYIYAQDYRIWIDCCNHGNIANVPAILFRYRIHDKAISEDKKEIQDDCAKKIMQEQLSWLHLMLPDNWNIIHYSFFVGRKEYNLDTKKWIQTLIDANKTYHVYNQELLKKLLWVKWAETTFFHLYASKGFERLLALTRLPVVYWVELLKIKRSRSRKEFVDEYT